MKIKITLEKTKGGFSSYRVKQITGAITAFIMNPKAVRSVDMIREVHVHAVLTEEEAKLLVQDEKYLITVK